jgi:hypothetical protein
MFKTSHKPASQSGKQIRILKGKTMDENPRSNGTPQKFVGMIVIAAMLVGVFGFIAALWAAKNGDWTGTGVCLVASSIAFGALFHGMTK